MTATKNSIRKITLIDDDPDESVLFGESLKGVDPSLQFSTLISSDALYPELEKFLPHLLFLDINIPGKDGFECLKELQDHPLLQKLPVVMYSNSAVANDIDRSYGLGASLYLQKPSTLNSLTTALRDIIDMAWDKPQAIAAQYKRENGHYIAF